LGWPIDRSFDIFCFIAVCFILKWPSDRSINTFCFIAVCFILGWSIDKSIDAYCFVALWFILQKQTHRDLFASYLQCNSLIHSWFLKALQNKVIVCLSKGGTR
jgi:hypothetical protein